MATLHSPNTEIESVPAAPALYHRMFARRPLERHSFNLEYVEKLARKETETATHFIQYFTKLLLLKLRVRMRSAGEADDVAQETLLRVLRHVETHGGIEHPEALGAFVNKVSEYVLLEFFRNGRRFQQVPENISEPVEQALSAELHYITQQRKEALRRVLATLKQKDRTLLEKVFLLEQDKDQICAELGISRNTLRVQVFRALSSLRKAFGQQKDAPRDSAVRKAAAG